MVYSGTFIQAVQHLMLYEIGGFVDVTAPGFLDGSNAHQSGYENDPTDPGGETNYGIAKNANPNIDIANLDWTGAQAIYFQKYWIAGHCDKMPGCVAVLHFDGCVNNGVGAAAKFLQNAVNVTADGAIGPGTLAAVSSADYIAVCNAICDQRIQYYNNIVGRKPEQIKYLAGWTRRIEEMRIFTTDPNRNF